VSEAEAGLVEAQEEWARVEPEVALAALPKRLNKTNLVIPKLTATRKFIQARLDLATASPSTKARKALRTLLEDVDKHTAQVNTRVDTVDRAAGYDEATTLVNTLPTLLARIEANARAGAAAVKAAVLATTGKEAKAQLTEVKHDLSGAVDLTGRIANIEVAATPHADLLALTQAHKVAAETAVQGLRSSVQAVTQIHAALQLLDSAKQTLAATRLLAASVSAAEAKLLQLEAHLAEEIEYLQEFESTLATIERGFSGGHSAESMLQERREYIAAVTEARDQAQLALQAARDAAGRIPAEELAVTQQELAVPQSKVGADTAADTEITRIDDLQRLRAKAQGQPNLAKLQALIPDNAKLEGLLDALGATVLLAWTADPLIGSAKAVALFDALGDVDLKQYMTDLGAQRRDPVVRAFTAVDLIAIHDATQLGVTKFVELLVRYKVSDTAKMVTAMTLPTVKLLTDSFTDTELGLSKLTVDQWIDLHTKFTAVKLKHWYTIFGAESIIDFLTLYTANTLNVFIVAVGEPRFEVLVRDKELKADALHKYGAPFLKDFAGVSAAAMQHLNQAHVIYNTDGKGNRISGGHAPVAFNAALNQVITPAVNPVMNGPQVVTPGSPAVRAGRSFNASPLGAECTNVDYVLHGFDGSDIGGGQKTLINTLTAQQAVWRRRGEEAIWSSIRALECNTVSRRWNGDSDDAISFSGYLAMDNKSVATFYPV
jgi:hypothetical protein